MSKNSPDKHSSDHVIIVRRRHGDHDDDHGGSWKIAYADFVTSMMAFFLLMWLINVTDDKAKMAIAQSLSDVESTGAGQSSQQEDSHSLVETAKESSKDKAKEKSEQSSPNKAKEKDKNVSQCTKNSQKNITDEDILKTPFKSIDQILKTGESNRSSSGGGSFFLDEKGVEQETSLDSLSMSLIEQISKGVYNPPHLSGDVDEKTLIAKALKYPNKSGAGDQKPKILGDDQVNKIDKTAQLDQKLNKDALQNKLSSDQKQDNNFKHESKDINEAKQDNDLKSPSTAEAKAEQTQESKLKTVKKNLQNLAAFLNASNKAPSFEFIDHGDTIEINIQDNPQYGMFAIGSMRPSKETIVIISSLAKIIKDQEGKIVIAGHTDGRPFRGTMHDNWQLSTARAQMVYYILLKAGVPKEKIEHIEGYADSMLKNKNDPYAAENRRIQIFLKLPKHKEIVEQIKQADGSDKIEQKQTNPSNMILSHLNEI